jgi:hypothetical protein
MARTIVKEATKAQEATEAAPVALAAPGGGVLTAEIEGQRTMALANPRDERKVLAGALLELEIAPDFARKAWYSIPYKNRTGGTEMVEGPSIKAAMALARRWGNSANGARIIEESQDEYIGEGVFIDYETNTRTLRAQRISKYYVDRNTKQKTLLNDQRLTMAVSAGLSKAVRNAVLATLPVYLVEAYIAKAKEVAAGAGKKFAKPVADRIKDAYKAFEKFKVTKDRLDAYIMDNFDAASEEVVLQNLIGVFNAIEDGQAKAEEVFAPKTEQGKRTVEGPVTLPGV